MQDDIDHSLETQMQHWRRDLPATLLPAVERHHANLLDLVRSMRKAGHGPEIVGQALHSLIQSYEADLLAIFQKGDDR